jgi:haloalkane dehalogenase
MRDPVCCLPASWNRLSGWVEEALMQHLTHSLRPHAGGLMSIEANAAGSDSAPGTSHVAVRNQLHGARYGEVLLVTGRLNRVEATVYNTLGLNDCPDDLWQSLDSEAIKKSYGARAVILNGPRYFLMDTIAIADPGEEIFDFGGLQMRQLATVPLPLTSLLGGLRRQPYTEQPVRRTTVYGWDQDREVYELVAPDGTSYVMQSYSLAVDPTLTEADLPALGTRLRLPPGWRYRVRQLSEAWSLQVDGEARVVQDELENSYQRVEPSAAASDLKGS